MPSSGLCRVILSSLRLADMLSTSNRHNPETLRWWLRGRFVECGPSTARQLAISKMKETGEAFCSVSAEAFIMGASGYLVASGARSRPPQWK